MVEKEKEEYYTGRDALAPVPMHVASAIIRPVDKNKLKAVALETIEKQANERIMMLKRQAGLIMEQVREIEERIKISQAIYEADIPFEPIINGIYHLYEKENNKRFLSMIGPNEWGKTSAEKQFVASVQLNADKTWNVISLNQKEKE